MSCEQPTQASTKWGEQAGQLRYPCALLLMFITRGAGRKKTIISDRFAHRQWPISSSLTYVQKVGLARALYRASDGFKRTVNTVVRRKVCGSTFYCSKTRALPHRGQF